MRRWLVTTLYLWPLAAQAAPGVDAMTVTQAAGAARPIPCPSKFCCS